METTHGYTGWLSPLNTLNTSDKDCFEHKANMCTDTQIYIHCIYSRAFIHRTEPEAKCASQTQPEGEWQEWNSMCQKRIWHYMRGNNKVLFLQRNGSTANKKLKVAQTDSFILQTTAGIFSSCIYESHFKYKPN